jgi:hypothetical protein
MPITSGEQKQFTTSDPLPRADRQDDAAYEYGGRKSGDQAQTS